MPPPTTIKRLAILPFALCCLFVDFGGTVSSAYGQSPVPRVDAPGGVWPREVPAGSSATMIEIRGYEFTSESVIRIDGQDMSTHHTRLEGYQIPLLTGVIPESLLLQPRSFEVTVFNPPPGGGSSTPVSIQVKPRLQPAKLEIELSAVVARQKDRIEVTVHLTNQGNVSFYVPTSITPFTGGNMLNSYHFEPKRPDDSVFTDPIQGFADGMWSKKPLEEELIGSGQIVLVAPGETHSGKARLHVDGLSKMRIGSPPLLMPGEYRLRMRFDPRFPPGADGFKTKFLNETLLSNVVMLKIIE